MENLLVDDDPELHQATQLVLKRLTFEGKPLTFISAYSGQEAQDLIETHPDTAVIVLDVVMETEDAGFAVVKHIREVLKNRAVRIILQTGQPYEAPEESLFLNYDINDYQPKVELSQRRLRTTMLAALRSYRDVIEVEKSRQELAKLYSRLQEFNKNLEQLVKTRTQELEEKNQQLEQEIRDRQLLERKLRVSEGKIRALFEAMTDIVLVIDASRGNIEIAPTNPGRLHEGAANLIDRTIEQFLQGEKAETWWGQIQRVLETKQTLDVDYSLPLTTDEQDSIWFTASISPLPDDSIIWVARNITDRKRTEAALRQSEEKFARAFRSSPSAITITRQSDGCHIEVNDSFCQFTGYARAEIIDRTAIELNLWENLEARIRFLQRLEKRGVIRNYEFNFRTKSGEIRTALLSAERIDLNGQTHIISVSQDISDRKQTEAQLRQAKEDAEMANRSKSQFLANMSHELRTPLNAIIGFAQLLERSSSLQQEQQDYIGIIRRSGEHLLTLINNVLQLSKIEVGRVTLDNTCFDLYQLLESLEEMFRLPAQTKGLQLVFDYASNLPQYIQTDESKLRQVLINLLGNAIKFTTEGGVTLRIKQERGNLREGENFSSLTQEKQPSFNPSQRPRLVFEIEDTGLGIAPVEMETLFEAFVQTETGRKSLEGTGLGLPISRQFVQLMGGNIAVNSTLEKGSIFKFYIEISLAQPSRISAPQATHKVIGLEAGQPEYRILVVDDRIESRLLLVKLLSSLGFCVREAVNGQEAIELWSSFEPHLIWMDMRMPIMDGYEATKRIKSHLKGQATIIIALTASAFEEERSVILSAGCDDFVRKPFREQVIFEKIAQYLGVRYLYEEQDNIATIKNEKTTSEFSLQPSDFRMMPVEWVDELYQASDSIDNDRIFQLIEQIPADCAPLAAAIADLTNNFRCDRIIELIEEARK